MIVFLHSLFRLFSQLVEFLEKKQSDKEKNIKNNQRYKADAYDKLQEAVKARDLAFKSNSDDDIMSDDGYQRKQ